jgi:pimeloyl-ACP methyl ester carboxylesterase
MARDITSGSPRLRVRTAVAAIVLGLVAVSVSTPYAAASSPRPGSGSSAIAWGNCDPPQAGLQCATVAVPLDWDHPNGAQINLAVIRHPASKPQDRIGTLFVNPGGPGSSGVDFVRDVFGQTTLLDDWGEGRFDVVSWDPRGTNRSSPVECFTNEPAQARFWAGVSIPSTPAESEAYQRKTVELARRCGEVSGELLSHITTTDTARDLDALRRLVGDDKLTYVGLSYGTMIGQTYANLFPGRVRAMMLDGIIDAVNYTTSAETRTASDVASTDEVFDQFMALCQRAGPAGCAAGVSVRASCFQDG